MNKTIKAHIFVLIATFIVAGSFLASAKLSGIISPISLTLYRFVLAIVVLAPIIFLKDKYRKKIGSMLIRSSIISLFYSLFFIAMFKSLESTTTLNTGTIFTLYPLITAVLSVFFFKQKISAKQFFIYLLGMIGTCIVVFRADLKLFLDFSFNSGDLIFLAGTLSLALYSVFIRYLHKKDDEALVLVFCTISTACVWVFLFLLMFDIPFGWNKIQGDLFLNILYLAIPSTLFTVYLFQSAGIIISPKKVSAYTYLNPAALAILLYLFDGVSVSFGVFFGILLSGIITLLLIF
ncbi:MAG: DMT family transporter [Arcobacter sp.]|nr:DMT family transporter [Arcobacter sp.]